MVSVKINKNGEKDSNQIDNQSKQKQIKKSEQRHVREVNRIRKQCNKKKKIWNTRAHQKPLD